MNAYSIQTLHSASISSNPQVHLTSFISMRLSCLSFHWCSVRTIFNLAIVLPFFLQATITFVE